jgi:hypothetical protein
MSRNNLPVAVDRAHTLWVWLDGRLVDFPIAARALAGRRLCDAAIDLLDALVGVRRCVAIARAHARTPRIAVSCGRPGPSAVVIRGGLQGAPREPQQE